MRILQTPGMAVAVRVRNSLQNSGNTVPRICAPFVLISCTDYLDTTSGGESEARGDSISLQQNVHLRRALLSRLRTDLVAVE
eukprot:SAG31_NODE_2734_length_5172_cov_2.068007_3_plen_82_part_00